MNETLDSAVNQLITRALEGVDTTVAFLDAELPEYIYQLLLWYGIRSGISFGVWLLLFSIATTFVVRSLISTWDTQDIEWQNGGQMLVGVVFAFFSLFFFSLTWLKIWLAPKVWLLEYAGSLVK